MNIEEIEIFSIEECRNNPDKLYIYGNNCKNYGNSGQAIIRDEINSAGISTKISPWDYMSDEEFELNKIEIDKNIDNILEGAYRFDCIVFPSMGVGTGRAMMMKKCPRTFLYLCKELLDNFGFNNIKNLQSKNF